MNIADESLYDIPEYKDGDECSQSEQQAILKVISESNDNNNLSCKKFLTEGGVFYWLETSFLTQNVVLEKIPSTFELVIKDTGEYREFKNYPGINSFRMRGNSEGVIFIYEGWNNPRKIIKLSVN